MLNLFKNRDFLISIAIGFIFLIASLVINSYAVEYATDSISNSVTDIVLSNTRVYDVDAIFVYGAVLMVLFIVVVCLLKPKSIPFVLKSTALFTLIRSFFLSLTHISPYPYHVIITPSFFSSSYYFHSIFTGDDLFFSGHTGLPFLMALIFWNYPILRFIFIFLSILFGIVVLLGHLHYSIDVAAAFFITYGIFVLATKFFKKGWEMFN